MLFQKNNASFSPRLYSFSRCHFSSDSKAEEVASEVDILDIGKYELWTTDSTYSFLRVFDPLKYLIADQWVYIAEDLNLGLGIGIVMTSVLVRLFFTPLAMYAQKNGIQYLRVKKDIDDIKKRREQYSDNKEARTIETFKIKSILRKFNIKPSVALFNIIQLPIHFSVFLLCNEFSMNCHIYPGIETDGFLWFKDLSYSDSTSILPTIGAAISLINVLSTSVLSINEYTKGAKRISLMLPVLALPVFLSLPCSFNLYWISSSILHCTVLNAFRFTYVRKVLKIPNYYPGTHLERLIQEKKLKSLEELKVKKNTTEVVQTTNTLRRVKK
ncbi:unnamed protein product [Moneuplotes crassus]|uniref:Membrane insertase YidC/Oxa/ALB C-terminal domain-containing protein n=1 Tax=Euplotes crassus TaxID=5936 RepID=A0AAD1XKW7_EUPCR|nr:unnamed protein product [Moneuplotes crassus]